MQLLYSFSTPMWRHAGGWYFLSLPKTSSAEIRQQLGWQEHAWGRMSVRAKIGQLKWNTAICYDSQSACYLLPVKAAIRKEAGLSVGQSIETHILV